MTKKHFEWFAQWIDQYPNLTQDYDALDDLMAYFEAMNDKFKRKLFLQECGFELDEISDVWSID